MLTITHAATAAAVAAAAANQTAKLEALRAPFVAAGGVTVVSKSAGGTVKGTGTYAPHALITSNPRKLRLGALSSYTAGSNVTPAVHEFWAGGTLIFTDDIPTFPGSWTANPRVNLCDPNAAGGPAYYEISPPSGLPVSAVPAWAANLAVNEWTQIANTALSSVQPNPLPALAGSTPTYKINAWCGAAYDRNSKRYIIGMAGGHADYAGNEINALRLSDNAPTWDEISARSPDATLYNRSAFNSDMKGAAFHTYYYLQVVDGVLIAFCNPGVDFGVTNPPYATPGGWPYAHPSGNGPGNYNFNWSPAFRIADQTWLAADYVPEYTGAGLWPAGLMCQNPATGDVYMARSAWWRFTAATRTWTALSGANEGGNYAGSAIDPVRGRMLIIGGWSTDNIAPRVRNISDGSLVSVTFGGLGASAIRNGSLWQYAGVMFDDANDRFLAVKNTNPITIYAIDAATWEVSLLSTTGTAPAERTNGIHNSCQYVPDLGGLAGVVIANSYTGNVHFLRTS